MFESRWAEMIGGEISGSVEILNEIQARNYPVYGLTNWGLDTFPHISNQFEFIWNLDGFVMSGDEKLVKPDPELFKILINKFQIKPENSVFIDDNYRNIESANKIGFKTILFVSPESLRQNLQLLNIL